MGFFLILPDALAQGLVPAIGDYLGRFRLRPTAVTAEMLDEKDRKIMYDAAPRSKYSERGRIHGREMTRRLLTLDNCLAVLVTACPSGMDASRLLHDLKGQSSFLKRQPGSLRELSSSADRCMSLIHTPDDAVEAARDAALFFAEIPSNTRRGPRHLDWNLISACRAWEAPSPHHSRYSIAVRLILRCAALLLGSPERRPTLPDYHALWFIYDSCNVWLKTPPLSAKPGEHERFLKFCVGIEQPAAALAPAIAAQNVREEMLIEIVLTLVRPDGFDHDEGLRVLERLAQARLMMTPYESHHLLTLMTFLRD